jgi:hypothetical protein
MMSNPMTREEQKELYFQDWRETDTPWKRWIYHYVNWDADYWEPCEHHPIFGNPAWTYRRKPQTRRIGEYDVPEPVREPLERGQRYWVASPTESSYFVSITWDDDYIDLLWLERGLIHLDKESARIHGKVLASLMAKESG